jgi:hypothetical protein
MRVVEPALDPGSPEAIAAGCTCSPQLNDKRNDRRRLDGQSFITDQRCPMHGLDALAALIDRGGPDDIDEIAKLLGQ